MPYRLCLMLMLLLAVVPGESEPVRRQGAVGQPATDRTRDITVSVMVPDLGWRISIREIVVVGQELWVISQLTRRDGAAGEMLTTVTDNVSLAAPPLPIKHIVVGKTWSWENAEPYTFVSDTHSIDSQLHQGQRLFLLKR